MNGLTSIQKGDKFGAVCVTGAGLDFPDTKVLALDDELSVFVETGVDIPEHWREWIGSIKADQIKESNLVIVARRPSARPDVADKDLEDASASARSFWEAICVAAIPFVDGLHFLGGARLENEMRVMQSYSLHPPRLTLPKVASPLAQSDLQVGYEILVGLRAVRSTVDFSRLKKGHRALQMGIRSGEGGDRLHQFVRSIEAVVKPARATGMRDFGERCSKGFLSGSDRHRELMSFSYDLRSVIEHMGAVEEFIKRSRPLQPVEDVFTQHLFQAEGLATALYAHVLRNKDVRELLKTDDLIDALWRDLTSAKAKLKLHHDLRPWPARGPSFVQVDPNWSSKIRSANARRPIASGSQLSVAIRAMDVQKYNWHDGVEALRVKLMISMTSPAGTSILSPYLRLRVQDLPCDYGEAKLQWSCHKGWKHDRSESDESIEVQAEDGVVLESEKGVIRVEFHLLRPFVRPLVLQLLFGSNVEAMHGPRIEVPADVINRLYGMIPFGDSQEDPSVGVATLFGGSLPVDSVVLGPTWPERT